jgi:hypothetical protein
VMPIRMGGRLANTIGLEMVSKVILAPPRSQHTVVQLTACLCNELVCRWNLVSFLGLLLTKGNKRVLCVVSSFIVSVWVALRRARVKKMWFNKCTINSHPGKRRVECIRKIVMFH